MPTTVEVYEIILNVFLHILILWAFLTVFFFFHIAKLSKDALDNELGGYIDEYLPQSLNDMNPADRERLRVALKNMPLEKFMNFYYATPSPEVVTNNDWNLRSALTSLGFLAVIFITMVIILKFNCAPGVSVWKIIGENIVAFTFVGLIEFAFFTLVAFKYVPVLPSKITNDLIARLKQNFSTN